MNIQRKTLSKNKNKSKIQSKPGSKPRILKEDRAYGFYAYQPSEARVLSQFGEHPLARDTRVTTTWRRGSDNIEWIAPLTGNPLVTLNWNKPRQADLPRLDEPKIRQEPRLPTGSCMALLYRLLTKAQIENPVRWSDIESVVIDCIGEKGGFYEQALSDALRLWSRLTVEWPDLKLPPPIEYIKEYETYGFEIHIHKTWLQALKKEQTPIVFPVPTSMGAISQNMILSSLFHGSRQFVDINGFMNMNSGSKRGMYTTPHCPFYSWNVVKKWFKAAGGSIEWARLPYTMKSKGRGLLPSRHMHIMVKKPKPGKPRDTTRKNVQKVNGIVKQPFKHRSARTKE